jgi:uncharacterized protein involved in response to NO
MRTTIPFSRAPQLSHWQIFRAAPHRMFFFAGTVQLVAAMLLWFGVLLGRTGAPLGLTVPPTWMHAFLMIFGVFPFFVFGFLLTVYPRWMSLAAVAPKRYQRIFALLAAGMLVFYAGLFSARALAAFGVLVFLVGWLDGLAALIGMCRRALRRGRHEFMLNLAMSAGAAGVASFAVALFTDASPAYTAARALGLWLFLGLTLFTVGHRMIPFFSGAALRDYRGASPAWGLTLAAALLAAHALLEWFGLARWLFLADLPLAVVAWQHTIRWELRRSLSVRILGMLHIAFAWFGVAMMLFAVFSLTQFAGAGWLNERVPLHAFTIGFVVGTVVAMVSRVTLAHSGRPMAADRFTWICFLGVNATALVRMAAELAPPQAWLDLNLAAAACWLAFLIPWVLRYAPLYLRARADGAPG